MKSFNAVVFLFFLLVASGCSILFEDPNAPGTSVLASTKTSTDLYNRAFEYYQAGNYGRARDLFHEYIGQYRESQLYPVALYYLGHCYQMLGDEKEALTIYNRVATTYGDDDFWGAQAMKRIKLIKGEE